MPHERSSRLGIGHFRPGHGARIGTIRKNLARCRRAGSFGCMKARNSPYCLPIAYPTGRSAEPVQPKCLKSLVELRGFEPVSAVKHLQVAEKVTVCGSALIPDPGMLYPGAQGRAVTSRPAFLNPMPTRGPRAAFSWRLAWPGYPRASGSGTPWRSRNALRKLTSSPESVVMAPRPSAVLRSPVGSSPWTS